MLGLRTLIFVRECRKDTYEIRKQACCLLFTFSSLLKGNRTSSCLLACFQIESTLILFFPAPCLSRKWNLSRTNIKTKKFIKSHFCSRINIQTQTRRVALNFKNLISYYFFLIYNNLKNLLQARYLFIDILIWPLILDRKRAYLKKFQPLCVQSMNSAKVLPV